MLKNILFDLDGTLINTLQDNFNEKYFSSICQKFYDAGYDGKTLSKAVLMGLEVMISNDGKESNEDAFWEFFQMYSGINKHDIIGLFDDFYDNEYDEMIDCVKAIEVTGKAINKLKEKGYNLILATNPLFPKKAIEKRAAWGNIDCENFTYITSCENSNYAKPNINYYKQIIENNNLNTEETMMFGNDLIEDLVVEELNIPCYIITNNMINTTNLSKCTKKGDYNEFYFFVNNLPKIN